MAAKAHRMTQGLVCPVCGTTYSRREHLQRHLTSHTGGSSHFCQACGKGFKRKDVLKRHFLTCLARPGRAGSSPETDQTLKTNRTACDRCARQKRACNSMQPCNTCTLKNSTCTYSWLKDQRPCGLTTSAPESDTKLERIGNPSNRTLDTSHVECVSPSLSSSMGDSDDEEELTDPFEFLTRFTSNDSGMSGAFEVDSSLLAEHPPGVGFSEPSRWNLPPHSREEQRTLSFEQEAKQARSKFRQDSLETYDRIELPHSIASPDSEFTFQSQTEPFFLSPWFETSIFAEDNTGTPQDAESHIVDHGGQTTTLEARNTTLSSKSHEIVAAIKVIVMSGFSDVSLTVGDWSALVETACISFFHPNNLSRYLEYYWGLWYPNVPTIHKPSFNAQASPCRLLAPMALIGATLSPNPADREKAKAWFDVVEEMVFSDETTFDSRVSTTVPCPPEQLEARLRSLQAAYAVCLYQNWEGRDAAKVRIRRQRFVLLISTARDLMRYANHGPWKALQLQDFSWKDFVLREELIRTIMYIFLLDTAFTIFNNVPPRMIIREMTNDLACPEPCFQACTAEDCFQKVREWTAHPLCCKRTTLYASIKYFGQKDIGPVTQQYLAHAGVLNLWTIVSAFHNLIFHIDPGFGSESQLAAMANAIINWKDIWRLRSVNGFKDCHGHVHLEPSPSQLGRHEVWKRTGFMRRAPEYWLLAQAKLERLESSQRSLEAAESLSGRDNWLANVPGTVLSKYDETSMEQLSEFISSFQAMRVDQEDIDDLTRNCNIMA
ncbi:hypothetical protein EDD37DRAFT_606874 [Exophiala viscosa]|uniref:Zn(2)-C6 fungal-type domain-containing protein n=1 Tax=Exophiala viscosa TaxID=2486360 RepID=A0AAN6E823_9EURO|nr:hypothetical protein EDD36DRAFT_414618 [Exophiala viscosa]KAI1628095.1 hypothetical protein EDD37DRAFT_606874 [Exophiala viscosa]